MNHEKDYTVFIAEDEAPARELLIEFVVAYPGIKLAGFARNGEEALQKLSNSSCDILLLDIDLPVYTGIEVLEKIEKRPRVIFTTAYEKHAVKAFELGADDYLVKPFTEERFAAAITKTLQALAKRKTSGSGDKNENRDVIMIREKGVYYIVPYNEIIYISSSGRNSVIHTPGREYVTGVSISSMTGKLPADRFLRIHKQFTINIQYTSHFSYYSGGQYILYLKDDEKTNLPVGKVYAEILKERIKFR